MSVDVDLLENDLIHLDPKVLDCLLFDHTTGKKIFWATHHYSHLGKSYRFDSQILPELITEKNKSVIVSRVYKNNSVCTTQWACTRELLSILNNQGGNMTLR